MKKSFIIALAIGLAIINQAAAGPGNQPEPVQTPAPTSGQSPSSAAPAPAGKGIIRGLGIDNFSLDAAIFRFDEDLLYEHTGPCLKGFVTVSLPNKRGKRMFCMVQPLVDGEYVGDNSGACTALFAFQPTSANYTGNVRFAIPYHWSGMNLDSSLKDIPPFTLKISILDFSLDEPCIAEKDITVDHSKISIDQENMILDSFSTLLRDSDGGSLIGEFFSSQETVKRRCRSCDGTGLCPHCNGYGYIDPSKCAKCRNNPGLCRRCNGSGEETLKVEHY